MNRDEFLKKTVRFLLFGLIAALLVITGRKATAVNDCSACPGKGICSGDSDCSTFLSDAK